MSSLVAQPVRLLLGRSQPDRLRYVALAITLLAFGLRVWALADVPPGWRDDELIETLVISQKMLDGDLAFYYPDASGHEALYHALNALFLAWFGPTAPGIRLLSAFLGTLAVPLTYALARRLFGPAVGLTAAALLAVSFWGLMYSRVGIRHVLTPPFALAAFYCFWRAIAAERGSRGAGEQGGKSFRPALLAPLHPRPPAPLLLFAASGFLLGLGFHSYFASRGAPLIPAAFVAYLALAAPSRLRGRWRGLLLMAGVAGLTALPLILAVAAQPAAEARVGELALPLIEARQGNFAPFIEHAVAALTMPHAAGDPEWLYNLPGRPVFGPVGALFFWVGVALAGWAALGALARRLRGPRRAEASPTAQASAFLLLWWLGGIAPAALSVPPASLGHVILAQPAFYILAALPVGALAGWARLPRRRAALLAGLAAMLLFVATAARDLPAYFREWPARGMVRFLYRADLREVADFVLRDPAAPAPADFGITGLLAGPWDRVALELALDGAPARPRWYNPERVLLLWPDVSFSGYPATLASPYADLFEPLPGGEALAGDYRLTRVAPPVTPTVGGRVVLNEAPVCFANHLCWTAAAYDPESGWLEVQWRAADDLALPPQPLISNPPPPDVYAGPRLLVFAHLLDGAGSLLDGDDGLWIDPVTVRAGDVFLQRHRLVAPDGTAPAAIAFGLYDPMTGERILTSDGQNAARLELER